MWVRAASKLVNTASAEPSDPSRSRFLGGLRRDASPTLTPRSPHRARFVTVSGHQHLRFQHNVCWYLPSRSTTTLKKTSNDRRGWISEIHGVPQIAIAVAHPPFQVLGHEHKKNKQTKCKGRTKSRKNNKARNPNDWRDSKNMASAWPDAIEMIVWRTIGGIWQQAHDLSWRLRPNTRHDRLAFARNKQTSGEEPPETTSDQGTRPCPHSQRSNDQSLQYTDETQPTTLVQTGGGRDNKNAEHCSPLEPKWLQRRRYQCECASMLVTQPDTSNQQLVTIVAKDS